MKIGGKQIDSAPTSDFIVFPRKSGDIAIRANAVMDRTDFDKLCPTPKPPKKMVKGGVRVDDDEAPSYKVALNQHGSRFIEWIIIESLCGVNQETQEDEEIEWEQVDRQKSETWKYWEDELKNSGFADMERKRIYSLVMKVNSLTEDRLDEARKSFLQPREEEQEQLSSQNTEQNDTPSGEPVNGSGSDHQASQKVGTSSKKSLAGG